MGDHLFRIRVGFCLGFMGGLRGQRIWGDDFKFFWGWLVRGPNVTRICAGENDHQTWYSC